MFPYSVKGCFAALATAGLAVAILPVGEAPVNAVVIESTIVAPTISPVNAKTQSLEPHVPGEVIIGFEPGLGQSQRSEVRRSIGAQSSRPLSPLASGGEVLTLGVGRGVAQAIEALRMAPGVRFAEPNYILTTSVTSNDPDYINGNLWGMLGATTSPANVFGTRAGEAWASGYIGSQNVVIGVIDEGFEVNHPDLNANIWRNPIEIAGNLLDDDANGYIDDVNGFDFANNDGTVFDGVGDDHGTHVAGTIGAKGGNGIGVAGVNWNVSMISAKFLGVSGGTTANAVRAVDYITALKSRYNLNIVATSNSWGGGGFTQSLLDAIERGGDAGILFIAAAGNSTSNNDSGGSYPSSYECTRGGTRGFDCVIAVASITSTGTISSFSSYGLNTVDIAAPGSGIQSTVPLGSYASYSGTSMATPHVSGAATLCRAANPAMTAGEIRSALINSVRSTESLAGKTMNAGRLDITALLKKCVAPSNSMTGSPTSLVGVARARTEVRLDWTDGVSQETGYTVQRATSTDGSCGPFISVGQVGADNNSYYVSGLQAGIEYCFRVGATNASTTQWSNEISVVPLPLPAQYTCQSSTYSWIEPPAEATVHTLTDDSSATVTIPFGFDLYGTTATSVQISSNGFLRFGSGAANQYVHKAIPSITDPNSIAAAWWMDFDPSRGGQVRSHISGVSPNRLLTISWIGILPFTGTATNGATFQTVLDEATRSITFQYQDTFVGTSTIDRGQTGTVGIEGSDGDYGTQIGFNTVSLTDLSAKRCSRSTGPVIASSTLVAGVLGQEYLETIVVTGGSGTKTLSVSSGSLPPGLTLSGFEIIGTPTLVGTYSFTLKALDQNNQSSTATRQIVITEPVGVSTSLLTAATVGSAYSQSLVATGGTSPYTWSLATGTLPNGLVLSSSGIISGTPTATAKNADLTVRVTDANAHVATAALQVRVNVSITTSSLPGATQGTPYAQTLASVGGAAGIAHTWSISSGSLPAGLTLSTNGDIGGTPSDTSTSTTFEVQASDGTVLGIARRSLTISVVQPLVIATSSLPGATIGTAYSQTLVSTGASGSTTWSLITGSLPAGLTLNSSTGQIAGTPSSTATSQTFTVQVSDSGGRTSSKSLSIAIIASTAPANFGKSSPKSGATRVSRAPSLTWGSSARATTYEYCLDRVNNNICDTGWVSVGNVLTAPITGLLTKTTYYWQVRAINTSTGEITIANTGTWWRFTTS